jgi:hypothetical protein
MTRLFEMFFAGLGGRLSDEDRTLLGRITDPASPDYLPRRADYYCSLGYSLFIGVRDG